MASSPSTGYPQFSRPDAMMSQLFDAGVDVFLTANNHTCDKGVKGIRRTIAVMDSLGIPHVVQPITLENKNELGVAQRVTVYSLGNFVSNQRKRYTDGGIIVKCQLVRDTTGVNQITDYEYLPYWVYKGTCQGKFQYHILPAKHAVDNCAWYNIHGADSVALNLFYQDTKSLIDSVPESQFNN